MKSYFVVNESIDIRNADKYTHPHNHNYTHAQKHNYTHAHKHNRLGGSVGRVPIRVHFCPMIFLNIFTLIPKKSNFILLSCIVFVLLAKTCCSQKFEKKTAVFGSSIVNYS